MASLSSGDIIAIVLGSVLGLIVIGFIIYYFIYMREENHLKMMKQYNNLTPDQQRSIVDYVNRNQPKKLNNSTQQDNSYPYGTVLTMDKQIPYPEETTNDRVLRQVTEDQTTPVR